MKSNKIPVKIFTLSASIIAAFIFIQLFVNSSAPEEIKTDPGMENKKENPYSIHSLDIPKKLSFAGENVPIEKEWVKESFDRELLVNTYWQSQTLLFIKRCNKYFPIIEPILKEQGVPEDFKYLAVIESGLMPRSVSHAGAAGIWQFMKATAREYGLEVNNEVDERYHLEKATVAACTYFKKMHEEFGDWTLVAASYNAGRTGIKTQLSNQKTDNYYHLLLGEETGRYVFRILAVKEILTHAEKYGFHVKKEHLYEFPKTQLVPVDSTINNIADFAASYNLSYKELKDFNPWLRNNTLTNSKKQTYMIALPK